MIALLDTLPMQQSKQLENVKQVWKLYHECAFYLWKVEISEQEVSEVTTRCDNFIRYIKKKFLDCKMTWYMHWFQDHVPLLTIRLYNDWKVGYGILTTQAMESRFVRIKDHCHHAYRSSSTF